MHAVLFIEQQLVFLLYPSIFAVTRLKGFVTSSYGPPFYAGTALTLTCNADLPDTVDPHIIIRANWKNTRSRLLSVGPFFQFMGKDIVFYPLRTSDSDVYKCSLLLKGGSFTFNYWGQPFEIQVNGK